MRTSYQAAPWKAATTPLARSLTFASHSAERLGDPSGFFSKAPFLPARPVGIPMIGSVDRTLILVNERAEEAPMEPSMGPSAEPNLDDLVEGVDITRPICRCHFAGEGSQLGQSCSKPTGGGSSGSAQFGAGETKPSEGPSTGTILVAGAVGVGLLYVLGII